MERGRFIVWEGLSGSGKTVNANRLVRALRELGKPVLPLNREPTRTNPFGIAIRKLIEGDPIDRGWVQKEFGPAVIVFTVEFGAREAYADLAGVRSADPERRVKVREFCIALNAILDKLLDGAELTELERQFLYIADRYRDLKDTIVPAFERGEWIVQDRFDLTCMAYGSAHGLSIEELYEWHRAILWGVYRIPDITFFVSVPPKVAIQRLRTSSKRFDRYEKLESLRRIDRQYAHAIAYVVAEEADEAPERGKERLVKIVNGKPAQPYVFRAAMKILRDIRILP